MVFYTDGLGELMRHNDSTSGGIPRGLVWAGVTLLAVFILYCVTIGLGGKSSYEFAAYVVTPLIAALMAAVAAALAFAQRTSRRLSALTEKIRLVAADDYSPRAEIGAMDELRDISCAFNSMVESLSRAREVLIQKANTDAVTGLANHGSFQERLASEFSRAARYGSKLSLIMIDLDHFKLFNDLNGHPAGDSALREIARVISEQVRDVDLAARYGGEEFAVVLPETGEVQAAILAERIRKAVEDCIFEQANPQSSKLTLSIGVAEFPSHCNDRATLLRAADSALYQAKMQGRNTVATYDGDCGESAKADPHKLYVLLHATDIATVEALAAAIDAKHGYPHGHSVAIARMASEVGRNMALADEDRTCLYVAALLRDIGQIAIADDVLEKSAKLSEQEMDQIEQHTILGHAIVQKSPHMSAMLPAVLYHHERFDGTGYPEGLSGTQIPLSARIIAAVDAYQSMMALRPYRDRLTVNSAQTELSRLAGTQFDPGVVEAVLQVAKTQIPRAA